MSKKIIDMSHVIVPDEPGSKFSIEQTTPDTINTETQWYVTHKINMDSHIGTHIEAPYHILENSDDLSDVSLEKLCGEAIILDLRGLPPKSLIDAEQVKAAAEKSGGIKHGDIVLCNMGYGNCYGQPQYRNSPYFTTPAIQWLVESGMKLLGVDITDVELPDSEPHTNHHVLFKRGIPLIENVTGFEKLTLNRIQLYAFPIAVKGLESFPVRLVAIEEDL